MKDYKKYIGSILGDIVSDMDVNEITAMVEVPSDEKMGDFAFPCFKLARVLRKAPNLIASDIAEKLSNEGIFEKVEAVNAYVNMFIDRGQLANELIKEVRDTGSDFGNSDVGQHKPVIVEYSAPNIAKPFHIGHIRSTVIGNALYKIMAAIGYDVIRINHLGDYGTQFGKMIVAYRKWGNKEDVEREPIKTLLSYYTRFHQESEKDPSLEDEARATFTKLEHGEEEETRLWQWFRDESLKEFNRVYDMLGITFDSYNGESFYSDKMARFIKELEEKKVMEPSMGANIVNMEDVGLGVALITKNDGSTLYITRDIAAAVYRKETYDFYKNIYVVASQQNLHFAQLKEILNRLGYEWYDDIVHVPFGLVSLEEGTMSTREGRVVFLEDVLTKSVEKTKEIIKEKNPNGENLDEIAAQVGIGAIVFQELSNNRIKDYTFSWDKVLNFDGETGPYVQYTHARCASLIRKGFNLETIKDFDESMLGEISTEYLKSDSAYALVKLLYNMPQVVLEAAGKYEPSVITRHIINIAQAFNRFYHEEKIITENVAEARAKLALAFATEKVLSKGLDLLGINAPERM